MVLAKPSSTLRLVSTRMNGWNQELGDQNDPSSNLFLRHSLLQPFVLRIPDTRWRPRQSRHQSLVVCLRSRRCWPQFLRHAEGLQAVLPCEVCILGCVVKQCLWAIFSHHAMKHISGQRSAAKTEFHSQLSWSLRQPMSLRGYFRAGHFAIFFFSLIRYASRKIKWFLGLNRLDYE